MHTENAHTVFAKVVSINLVFYKEGAMVDDRTPLEALNYER
jgi:hypothetical protein